MIWGVWTILPLDLGTPAMFAIGIAIGHWLRTIWPPFDEGD